MSTAINSFFSGKSILITGASSGLGWALAEALAPCRVKLGLLGRNTEKLQELAAKLRYTGSEFIVLTCDVQDRHAVEQSVQEFHQLAGGLDMVWVNSGISRSTFFPNWDWQNVEAIINTNIMGAMYTTKACADIMVQQDSGTIVAIGSVASMRGLPKHGIYSMTKIALNHYIESLVAELPQLHFILIHPGFVDTAINQGNPNRVFLMTADKAAQLMLKAVAKRKRYYIYPWQFRLLYPLVRALPASLYQSIAKKLVKMRK
ncbi:MAG: SDR family NAD(P)-dependent oxidoreductase [Deferribacteres bacterium]|nr:SDR family NAD(P)-dependent oxidoreductase [candidate division KSB1 bacterium]MCB9510549.1 SDR family NAD(P)-dependent oxidoreductase [Deferribacteres bacterium]